MRKILLLSLFSLLLSACTFYSTGVKVLPGVSHAYFEDKVYRLSFVPISFNEYKASHNCNVLVDNHSDRLNSYYGVDFCLLDEEIVVEKYNFDFLILEHWEYQTAIFIDGNENSIQLLGVVTEINYKFDGENYSRLSFSSRNNPHPRIEVCDLEGNCYYDDGGFVDITN